jgi:ATP-binding cassette, subfamily B, bacterial
MQADFSAYFHLLWKYLRPQRSRVALLGLILLSTIALKLISPQILRAFIDAVQDGSETSALVRLALYFLVIAFIQQFVSVGATYFSENTGWTATNALRSDLARHCIDLDMTFHNAHSPGEMIERIDGDVTALSNFFSKFVIMLLGNTLLMVGVLVLLFRENWIVGGAITFFVLLTLFVMLRFRNIAVPHFTAERQASAELFGFLEERLAGTEDIRANGGKAYTMERFHQLMRVLMQKALKASLMGNVLYNTMWTLFSFGTAVAFAVGAYFFLEQAITIGTVYIIYQYTQILNRPIDEVVHQISDMQRAGAGISRVRQLFSERSKLTCPASSIHEPRERDRAFARKGNNQERDSSNNATADLPPALEFQAITFGYDDSLPVSNRQSRSSPNQKDGQDRNPEDKPVKEMVLKEVSFHLEPGEVLGVLGRTGSGKTSLTRLVFRLYDPDQGAIRIGFNGDLQDLRRLPLEQLRRQVGMVTQNIQLFQASVRDNLTFFDRSISDRRLLDVLHDLGLGGWYSGLPNGLDSELSSGGGGGSAGEGQLLAFARIFLKDPGLVILDEASSRLDPATEHLIEKAIDRLLENRTALIVAHRLVTVHRARKIMILENGQVCEYGDREALLASPASRFSQLMKTGMDEVLA